MPPPPPATDAAAVVARFLRSTPGIPAAAVGAVIAAPAAAPVLAAYCAAFDWRAAGGFDDALRSFLAAARLPIEPAAADRVLAAWAAAWYDACVVQGGDRVDRRFASADAAHVLAFSAVLLNTDAHSAAVRAKMTLPQFEANLAGANAGGDFDGGLLADLYASVTARPMLVPGAADSDACGAAAANGSTASRATSASGLLRRRSSQGGGGSGAKRRRWWGGCWAG